MSTDLAALIPERYRSRIDVRGPGECWPWTGYTNRQGYGQNNSERVHREVLIAVTGMEGPQACHSCDNPPCCNPHHLRWGTNSDNQRDAVARGRHRTGREAWTHCVHGHEFTPENTRIRPNGNRLCRTCERDRCRIYRAERRKRMTP